MDWIREVTSSINGKREGAGSFDNSNRDRGAGCVVQRWETLIISVMIIIVLLSSKKGGSHSEEPHPIH